MTPNEQMIEDIVHRVRATICPTLSEHGMSVQGRISEADFNFLLSSHEAWKITAKQAISLANLSPDERVKVNEEALDALTVEYMQALEEIDRLRGHRGVPN